MGTTASFYRGIAVGFQIASLESYSNERTIYGVHFVRRFPHVSINYHHQTWENIMPTDIKYDRRHFLSDSVRSIAAGQLGMIGLTNDHFTGMHPVDTIRTKQTIPSSFEKIKQIDAGVLNAGYVDDGPALWSFFCTAGLMIFIAMLMWFLY